MQFNKKSVVITVVAVACVVLFLLLAQNKTYTGQAYGLFSTPKADSVDPLKEKVSAEFIPTKEGLVPDGFSPKPNPTLELNSCEGIHIPISQADIDAALSQNLPFEITQPGYYCFTENLEFNNPHVAYGIKILAPSTIDLNGYIFQATPSSLATAFKLESDSIRITNGRILFPSAMVTDSSFSTVRRDWKFDNLIFGSPTGANQLLGVGIYLPNSIDGLVLEKNQFMTGQNILAYGVSNSVIRGNTFNSNDHIDLMIQGLVDSRIEDNNFANYLWHGVRVYDGENSVITNNEFLAPGAQGAIPIELRGHSVDIEISYNHIQGNSLMSKGVQIGPTSGGTSSNLLIANNVFEDMNTVINLFEGVASGVVANNKACRVSNSITALPLGTNNLVQQNNNWNAVNC